ncbi:MAG: RodZ domain-containing protein [Thermodesulforhabdaceae bacterium]
MTEEQNLSSPKDIGAYLKRCREEKGISLLYISETTKISPQLLRAIEEGQWEKLYSSFFLINFLKAYCKVIGEPYEPIVRFGKRFFLPIEKQKAERYKSLLVQRAPIFPNRGKVMFYLSVVAISLLMLVGGLFLSNRTNEVKQIQMSEKVENPVDVPQEVVKVLKDHSPVRNSSESKDSGTSIQEPEKTQLASSASGKQQGTSLTTSAPLVNIAGIDPKQKAVEAGVSLNVHRLVIEATDETWVKVWIDNNDTPVSRLLADSERIEFEVKERAKVKIGNAAAARIIWDDKTYEKLGKKGRTIIVNLPKIPKSSEKHAR